MVLCCIYDSYIDSFTFFLENLDNGYFCFMTNAKTLKIIIVGMNLSCFCNGIKVISL